MSKKILQIEIESSLEERMSATDINWQEEIINHIHSILEKLDLKKK